MTSPLWSSTHQPASIVVADFGLGNILSLSRCLDNLGLSYSVTQSASQISTAGLVILPGVGAFGAAMSNLQRVGADKLLQARAKDGAPILGICLGMQLLFEASSEGEPTKGLGIIGGDVRKIPAGLGAIKRRVPHVGWNTVDLKQLNESFLRLSNRPESLDFYFTHSYYCVPKNLDEQVGTTSLPGLELCAVVKSRNTMGVQFHPEKSGASGHLFLANAIDALMP